MENKMTRVCPVCDGIVTYKSKISHKKALRLDRPCITCSNKERCNRPEERIKNSLRLKEYYKTNPNPFFGKEHTKETKDKIRVSLSGKTSGTNNGMYGKNFFDIWVEKYGKEVADEKLVELRRKQSLASSGENNPMYGKTSPKGSGNGWSGWYKGWFFRSLHELTFMINVIERFGFEWKSAETNQYKIGYIDYKGTNRNYFPDFILNDKYLVECKPRKLWESKTVLDKKNAALEFCKNNGLIYKMVDVGKLSEEKLKSLYDNNEIKLTKRYEQKYKEKYCG